MLTFHLYNADMKARVMVQVHAPFNETVSRKWLSWLVREVLASEGSEHDLEIGLVITDDATVKELNGRYRGEHLNTDVLSFSFDHSGHYEGAGSPPQTMEEDFVVPPSATKSLGEVIVSYPEASRQASRNGVQVKKELAKLVTHGTLHLLGYDHIDPKEERHMVAKQEALLKNLL